MDEAVVELTGLGGSKEIRQHAAVVLPKAFKHALENPPFYVPRTLKSEDPPPIFNEKSLI